MVRQLIELIEDDYILASFLQLDALIEDFFYIRFASWRGYDFFGHSLEPIESLAAHSFGRIATLGQASKREMYAPPLQ